MRFALAAAAAAIAVSGCASRGPELGIAPGTYTSIQPLESAGGLPAPSRADLTPEGRPYLIGPFDRLRIDVLGIDDLSREVQADASGRISYPLLGVIDATGKTPQELQAEITAGLRSRYVRDPEVTVNVTETVNQVVTVDGQVTQPGQYPVVGRMTLLRAIASARGTTEFARQQSVLIFREVDGQQLVGLYNLQAIRRGLYADPEVFPNDVVVVDEDRARRLFRDLIGIAPILTAPLIAVLQNNN